MTSNTRLSILKPGRPREPLQDLSQLIPIPNNEEEETTTTDNHKRRVSFAAVNKVKEFETGAECTTLHQTPAYDERFSTSSDSYQSSMSECSHNKSTFITSRDSSVTLNRSRINDENIDIVEITHHNMSKIAPSPGKMSAGDSSMDITSVIVREEYTDYESNSESYLPLNLTKSRQSQSIVPEDNDDNKDLLETSSMETTEALPCMMTETIVTDFETFNQTMDVSVEEIGIEEENDYRLSMNPTIRPEKIIHSRKSTIFVSEKDVQFTVDAFGDIKDTKVQENIFVQKQVVNLPMVESSAMEEDTSLNIRNHIIDKENLMVSENTCTEDGSDSQLEETEIIEREMDMSISKSFVPAKDAFCFVSNLELTEKDMQSGVSAIETQGNICSENTNLENKTVELAESIFAQEQSLHFEKSVEKEENLLPAKNTTIEMEKNHPLIESVLEDEKHSHVENIVDENELHQTMETSIVEENELLEPVQSPVAQEKNQSQLFRSPVAQEKDHSQRVQSPVAQEKNQSQPVQSPVAQEKDQFQPVQSPVDQEKNQSQPIQSPVAQEKEQFQPVHNSVAQEKDQSQPLRSSITDEEEQFQPVHDPGKEKEQVELVRSPVVEENTQIQPVQIPDTEEIAPLHSVRSPVAQEKELFEPAQSPIVKEKEHVQPVQSPVAKETKQLQPVENPVIEHDELLKSVQNPVLLESVENPVTEESNFLHDEILTAELQNCHLIENTRIEHEESLHSDESQTNEKSTENAVDAEEKAPSSPKNVILEENPISNTSMAENSILEEEVSQPAEMSVIEMEESHPAENFDKNDHMNVESSEKCSEDVVSSRPLKRKSDSFVPEIPPPEPSPKRPNTEINLEIVQKNEAIRNQIKKAIKRKEIPYWTEVSLGDTEWTFGTLWNRLHLVVTLSETDVQCTSKLRFIKKDSEIGDEILKVAIAPIIRKYRKKMDELCGRVEDVAIFMKMTLPSINFAQRFAEDFSEIIEFESISLDNGFASFLVANYKSHLLAKIQVDMRNIEDFSDSSLKVIQNIGNLDDALVRRIFFEARGDFDFFSKFVNNLNRVLNS